MPTEISTRSGSVSPVEKKEAALSQVLDRVIPRLERHDHLILDDGHEGNPRGRIEDALLLGDAADRGRGTRHGQAIKVLGRQNGSWKTTVQLLPGMIRDGKF